MHYDLIQLYVCRHVLGNLHWEHPQSFRRGRFVSLTITCLPFASNIPRRSSYRPPAAIEPTPKDSPKLKNITFLNYNFSI